MARRTASGDELAIHGSCARNFMLPGKQSFEHIECTTVSLFKKEHPIRVILSEALKRILRRLTVRNLVRQNLSKLGDILCARHIEIVQDIYLKRFTSSKPLNSSGDLRQHAWIGG